MACENKWGRRGRGARPRGRPREGCDIRQHASRGRSRTVRERTSINRTASRGCREVMMLTREVLVIVPVSDDALNRIAAVDRCLHVVDARGRFDVELRETWRPWTVQRYLGQRLGPISSRQERDQLLANAEIILGGFPFPLDLRARAPQLRWVHQRPAGASNLLRGDLWGSDVIVTTSRGEANPLPIAEYAVAAILYFAKDFNRSG